MAIGRKLGCTVDCFGSTHRTEMLAGVTQRIHEYEVGALVSGGYDYIFDCAFLTRSSPTDASLSSNMNTQLNDKFAEVLSKGGFGTHIYFSSGAVHQASDSPDGYSHLKKDAERISSEGRQINGQDSRVVRLWNVSGPFCRNRKAYALTSLIDEARATSTVRVRNASILRRYANLEQIVAFSLLNGAESPVSDTGGISLTLEELSVEIASMFSATTQFASTSDSSAVDYLPRGDNFETVLRENGIEPMDIRQQILSSI